MKCITIGLDVGNDSIKLVDSHGYQVIPNVTCRSSVLKVYDDRVAPDDYLNFSLLSDAASGDFFLGHLAARQDSGRTLFMSAGADKAEQPQYYVAALGALAFRALTTHLAADESELAIRLVLSLPMRDWFRSRGVVERKLLGDHLVNMGSMPLLGERTVHLRILDVYVSIEGMAALVHGVFDHQGRVRNASLRDGSVRIVDIGKETTDLPKVKRMVPQPEPESTWEDWGAGRYLDSIIRKVRTSYGLVIPNPARLVDSIVNEGARWKTRGRTVDLWPVVREEFEALAERAARTVEANFADDVDICIMVGGAADAIKPFLGNFLDYRKYPVVFGQEGECYLENARGNYILGLGRKWPAAAGGHQGA